MAESSSDSENELSPFVLSYVQLTGTRIGVGSYATVEEVSISAAAKRIHSHFLHDDESVAKFKKECKLMSTIRHPNIVQFLGVCYFSDSRLPALVMERMLTTLHSLLQPEPSSPLSISGAPTLKSVALKFSVLCDIARGVTYLHEQSPPIIHRDLSARNVLLNSAMVAKISDLGMARTHTLSRLRQSAGTSVYMPPDAEKDISTSIDIFSLGVIAIFTIGENYPGDLEPPTSYDDERESIVPRTEVERRSKYMKHLEKTLDGYFSGQGSISSNLFGLIQQCLHNGPHKRPSIGEVLRLLEEARAGVRDDDSERNKRELVRALQTQPRNKNSECVIQDLVTENADLQSRVQAKDRELAQKEKQLQAKDRELAQAQQQLREKVNPGESKQYGWKDAKKKPWLTKENIGKQRQKTGLASLPVTRGRENDVAPARPPPPRRQHSSEGEKHGRKQSIEREQEGDVVKRPPPRPPAPRTKKERTSPERSVSELSFASNSGSEKSLHHCSSVMLENAVDDDVDDKPDSP